jgi:DNA-binding NarL/FixJ family response regulator
MKTGPTRILIADDHAVTRHGLKQILAEEFQPAEFAEAEDGPQTLKLVSKQKWDVLVLDITMPGMNGLEVLKDLKNLRPNLPVLVLSMHPEDQYGIRTLKAGASGYLTKEADPDELVAAVRRVLAGRKYISPSLADDMACRLADGHEGLPHERLSDRELQVMLMLAAGKAVSEIAEDLSLSVKTITTHRTHILKKMKMKTNADLTRYCMENNLLD